MDLPHNWYSLNDYPLPSWLYDLTNAAVIDVNDAALALFGYTKEHFLASPPFAGICFEKGNLRAGPFVRERADGSTIRVELFLKKITVETKEFGICSCVEASIPLADSDVHRLKLLESVIMNTTDAVIITEAESTAGVGHKIVYVNEAFTRMTGYEREEVIGLSPKLLQGRDTSREELDKMAAAISCWSPCETTLLNYKKSGQPFWLHISLSPVADETGWFTHWIAIERDVSSQVERQLEKALLLKISQLFNQTNDLALFLDQLCIEWSTHHRCSFGELWLPSPLQDKLELAASCALDAAGEAFYEQTNEIPQLAASDGMPGKVWNERQSLVADTNQVFDWFLRRDAANGNGIRYILGIPLFFQKKLVAVYLAGTKADPPAAADLATSLEKRDTFIGAKIYRKRMEREHQLVFDSIPDIICTSDFNGRFLKINKIGAALLGYSEAEILGKRFDHFIHPADRKKSWLNAEKLVTGEQVLKFENRFITKSGKAIWLSWNCNPSVEDGMIFATGKDISNEKKLQVLVEDANTLARIGGWEVDFKQGTVYWSYQVHQLHGTDPERYQPTLSEGIHFYREDFREKVAKQVEQTRTTGEPLNVEAVILTSAGKERWVRVLGRAEWHAGECTRIFGSFQDIHDRKTLEVKIRQILDSIGDAFFTMDRNFTVTYWNRRAEELLKVKQADILNRIIWEVFPDAVNLPSFHYYKQVLETGESIQFEDYYGIWLEVNAYPSEEGISVFFRDISLRKEADARLQKAYEERTTILESIGDAFFAVDTNWVVTYWNKMAEQLLFKKKEDIVGKHLWTEYADAIDSDFYRMYHQAKETGETVSFEEYYVTLGKWFEVTAYPSEAGLSVYFKDITLRKEIDIRIREANERFEKVSEATNEAIWDWNIPENTLFWGSGFQTIFGYDVERLSPTLENWSNHIHEAEREQIIDSFIRVVQDPAQQVWEKEYQYLKANGSIAQVVDRAIIIRDAKGEAIRAVGALQDITYRKKIEEELKLLNEDLKVKIRELEQANEELEQFAFIASHDLQEPLRMVSSFMEQLKRKYGSELDYKAHQYIHYAMDGAKRMKKIILDLLDYSRAGQVTGEPERVNLDEIVKDYLYLRNKLFTEKGATLLVDPLPEVRVYKAPLIQTLHSLLDNAVKYSRPDSPPVIQLTAEAKEKEWVIAVKDNGIGIPNQYFDKIFVIFQRLHNRDQFEGTGIGLAMVKKHVESWGGRVWVASEPGQGSTFYFTINR